MINFTEPKKIAVLRANALGDYIFVIPALKALRERFPSAEIVYLGRDWHKEYLNLRPGPVDRVVVVPRYPGISEKEGFVPDPAELDPFFEEMEKEEFDIAFQLHGGGGNSNPFLLRLGAKLNVGLKTPNAVSLDISVPYVYYFSETLRYLEVVGKVGAKTLQIEPEIAVTEKDLLEARSVIGYPEKAIAILHPGASDLRRRWPAERFARIADYLAEQGFMVYVTGAAFEAELIAKLMRSVADQHNIQNLCNKLTLGGLTGLLSIATLIISNDTGPLHLARALKTPTVGIYWFSNAITGLPMSTFYHRHLLSLGVNCPLCGLPSTSFGKDDSGTCLHNASLVTDVTVEAVEEQIEELLELINKKHQEKGVKDSTRAA